MEQTRKYTVAQVPRRAQPDVQQPQPPPDGGAETFLSLLWGIYKLLVDHFGFILVLVVAVLIHIYLQQLLQLSPRAQS
ncbi:hypothetical protein FRC04_006291 [Tulasnella sp. 424]|nr:hypothetical protein FRC04_006291 [Tulasnella sp. 424]KAG8980345.1 hypothetical protein FRC05_005975 [Tulasnella sp. 425]